MRRKKAYIWLMAALFMLSGMAGCSKKENVGNTDISTSVETTPEITEQVIEKKEEEVTPTQTETEATPEAEEVTTVTIPEFEVEAKEIPDSDSMRFVESMKLGWSLGNTLDANSETNKTNEMSYESSWCGIKTTPEMIDAVKEAGFNTVRVPVSWHNHVSGDDFTISAAWLSRVKEIVDYAINDDMYVILNIHHDCLPGYYYPNSDNLETSTHYITSIWQQLCSYFGDYDDHLIFEGINEPRLKDTNYEWWLDMNNEQCKDAVDCINQLNQVFVDTVRANGGNNETRYLMVPGYDASAEYALIDQFVLPTDLETNEGKIIVSVHAYTPYNFALQAPTEDGNTDQFSITNNVGTADIKSFMDRLYTKYVSNDIPVVVGEFGARDKNGNIQARSEYAAFYVAYARANGISCCWWDNNAVNTTGENFGLLDRKTLKWGYPEVNEALVKYSE